MTSIKGMEARSPPRAQHGDEMLTPVSHEIDLGSGSRAKLRYDNLSRMLGDVISWYRGNQLSGHANILRDYSRTLRWKYAPEQNWIIELLPDEWQALSRGLRALDTPAGRNMNRWLCDHRITEYDDGG